MTRPGGVIVYATCTYAPEENERVLDGIWPEKAAIEKIEVPEGLHVSPGIAEWEGRTFRSDVQNAIRFWPHRSDTGGFFMAKLRRL
jgi:16S rRNA C967 or C1407 C5-methylase (RsmB/RsmF family)